MSSLQALTIMTNAHCPQGIVFSLIIVRVGLGLTSDLTYTSRDVMSTIVMSDRHPERTMQSTYSRRTGFKLGRSPAKPSPVILSQISHIYSSDSTSTRLPDEELIHPTSSSKYNQSEYKIDIPYLTRREHTLGKLNDTVCLHFLERRYPLT